MNDDLQWIAIDVAFANIDWHNNIAQVTAGDKTICLVRQKNNLYACAHKCPHAGGYFKDGFVDALGNLVCPLHYYRFNVKNGHNTTGEGYRLQHWPVRCVGDVVSVGFPPNYVLQVL